MMARISAILAAVFLLLAAPVQAQTISSLPSATLPLSGNELTPVVQGGATKKVTVGAISGFGLGPTSNVSFGTGLFSKSHLSTTGIGATLEGIYATGATAPPRNFAAVQGLVELDTPTGSTNNQTGAEYFVGGIFTSQANVSNGGVGTITLTGTVHSTDVTLPVSSITGIRNGDSILVTLDNGSLFSTVVNGAPSGSNVLILPAMPGTATSGNKVYDYAGQVQAVIASGQLAAGGKKFFGSEAIEANSSLRTGSSVFFKCIICTSGNLDDAVQADGPWDMAIGMSGQNGSIGAKAGIAFGPWSGVHPVQSTGTLIKTFEAATVANGIDFSSYTITGDAWKSPGFEVAGNGTNTQTSANPSYVMRATGAAVTAGGLWRLISAGGVTVLQVNTAAGGDFSTHIDVLKFTDTGGLQLSGTTVDPGVGAMNAGAYVVGDVVGVTCSGSPTSSFAAINGIVTHC
jgi:hypothetical protein